MQSPPLILGIETSCDDTACAVLDGQGRVLASVVSSQLAAHRPYGGVVPEIASREHLTNWPRVSAEALAAAGIRLADVDVVAATRGPGLVGALLVGLSLGKAIAFALERPFHAVHHLEGHLYSPFLPPRSVSTPADPADPVPNRFIGLVVSGGHTSLFAVEDGAVSTLGETRDDAMGEVFDKVGKRLGLPYPQGPRVDELAERGDPAARRFAAPFRGDSLDFSYSGLKSQALLEIEKLERAQGPIDPDRLDTPVLDLLAGFRAAAVAQILHRLDRLHADRPIPLLAVSGGVAANRLLRRELTAWAERNAVALRLVPLAYAGDNAAMIAHAALLRQRRGQQDDPFAAEAESRIVLGLPSPIPSPKIVSTVSPKKEV
jgi:N6-L-threonylcarbamoyladenine synthase